MELITKINPKDNVATVNQSVMKGEVIQIADEIYTAKTEIIKDANIALKDFVTNDVIIKYGYPIAVAAKPIKRGEAVTRYNICLEIPYLSKYAKEIADENKAIIQDVKKHWGSSMPTLSAYKNRNSYGIRNYTIVVARKAVEASIKPLLLNGELLITIEKDDELQPILKHPNARRVIVIGFVVEEAEDYVACLKEYDEEALKAILLAFNEAKLSDKKTSIPYSEMKIGIWGASKRGKNNRIIGQAINRYIALGSSLVVTFSMNHFNFASPLLKPRFENPALGDKLKSFINAEENNNEEELNHLQLLGSASISGLLHGNGYCTSGMNILFTDSPSTLTASGVQLIIDLDGNMVNTQLAPVFRYEFPTFEDEDFLIENFIISLSRKLDKK